MSGVGVLLVGRAPADDGLAANQCRLRLVLARRQQRAQARVHERLQVDLPLRVALRDAGEEPAEGPGVLLPHVHAGDHHVLERHPAPRRGVLADMKCDGWLLFDFHGLNPVATRVLGLSGLATRRLALTKVGNPEIGHKQGFGIRQLIQASPTGVVCCFASGGLASASAAVSNHLPLPPKLTVQGQGRLFRPVSIFVMTSCRVFSRKSVRYMKAGMRVANLMSFSCTNLRLDLNSFSSSVSCFFSFADKSLSFAL